VKPHHHSLGRLLPAALLLAGAVLPAVCAADDPRTRDYSAIDEWALNVPAVECQSPERLAAYLVQPAQDDFDKARALFRWLAANIVYDVPSYLAGVLPPAGVGNTFQSGRAVCEGFSSLFEQMGKAVGLEVVTIHGWGKGYGYTPGQVLGQENHAWNAIRVGEEWYLLDPTWGGGYVNEARQYVQDFEAFYFLTPPDQFLYSHLPTDPRWQLLQEPVSAETYSALVRPQPDFFDHGLELLSHREGLIRTNGQLTLALRAPDGVFMLAKVLSGGRDLTPRPLSGKREGDQIGFDLPLQGPAVYELKLYATTGDEYGMYDHVVKYRIDVTP
jgi:transglutaminase/protease-like cytokinesis protein 3